MKPENAHKKTSKRFARWLMELRTSYKRQLENTNLPLNEKNKLTYRLKQLESDILDCVEDSLIEEIKVIDAWTSQ